MDQVLMARVLFGLTLAWHIIFSTLGVGIPFMILVAELLRYVLRDRDFAVMAKRWTKGFTVLLAVGITSGTTVALQLSLLWPRFMHLVGQVIALPFLIEIFAFFIEALFMSIYIYAYDRLRAPWRMVSLTLVAFGAALSAVLITDANAFMNTPQGFRVVNGNAVDIHPWVAVFNPALLPKMWHVLATAYMTVAFVTASIAAFGLLKAKTESVRSHQHKALTLSLFIGVVFSLLTVASGDDSGKFIAKYQPEKLAAGEGLFNTQAFAPFIYGGWPSVGQEKIIGGIQLPGALSWLATGRFQGLVRGLHEFPRSTWPPLYIHYTFDAMITIGSLLLALAIWALALALYHIKNKKQHAKWMLMLLVASGPLAIAAIECGWVYAEVGRQPWIVFQVMRTAEAVTAASHMGPVFVLFIFLYALLSVGTVAVLQGYFRRHPLQDDLERGPAEKNREVWLP